MLDTDQSIGNNNLDSLYVDLLILSNAVETNAPAAPANLSVAAGDGSISLNWDSNSETDLLGYSVYRSTNSGIYGAALTNGLGISEYVDNSASAGITYNGVGSGGGTAKRLFWSPWLF